MKSTYNGRSISRQQRRVMPPKGPFTAKIANDEVLGGQRPFPVSVAVDASVLTKDLRLNCLRFGSFRHPKSEDGQGHERGATGGKKSGAVSEVIDDLAGSKSAQ